MARWIKVDGTEQEVKPANGYEFTHDELHNMVDGLLTGITLTGRSKGGLYMFMDDSSIIKGKPFNQAATTLVRQYRPEHAQTEIFGDVVVAGIDETGDE
jgi:hypothetical protein